LTKDDISWMYEALNADFNVGVFDACYAGSLDEAVLSMKGVDMLHGVSLVDQLPEEVLTTEGNIWFVSSGPREVSYEDEKLGGVFTHFFIEALHNAPKEGAGIPLDNVWQYARSRTVAYTSRHGHRQNPQQLVSRLKSTAPLYFSFPSERNSTLVLAEELEGDFVVSYADGQLVDTLDKKAGAALEIPVLSGTATVALYKAGEALLQDNLVLEEGSRVVIKATNGDDSTIKLGRQESTLWTKGLADITLEAKRQTAGWSVLLGPLCQYQLGSDDYLFIDQRFGLGTRLDHNKSVLSFDLSYGQGEGNFTAWSYTVDGLVASAQAGYGFDLGTIRLTLLGGLAGGVLWQKSAASTRNSAMAGATLGVNLLWSTESPVSCALNIQGGLFRVPGSGRDAPYYFAPSGSMGMSCYYRLK
jgi:hypothetical protein